MSNADADPRLRQAAPQQGKAPQSPPRARATANAQQQNAQNAPPQNPARDGRADLFEAVTTRREQVLTAFDTQRQAILKAVADQREQVASPMRFAGAGNAGAPPAGQGGANAGATRPAPTKQELVAADIVVTLKAMVSEEVRTQLLALLDAAAARERALRAEPQRGS